MALSGCDFKKQNLEKNKLQKDIYTTIKGGKLPLLIIDNLVNHLCRYHTMMVAAVCAPFLI